MKDLFARFALPILALGITMPAGTEADAKTKTTASSQAAKKPVVKKPAAKKPAAKPAVKHATVAPKKEKKTEKPVTTKAKKAKASTPAVAKPKKSSTVKAKLPKSKTKAPAPAASRKDKPKTVAAPSAPTGQCARQKGSWKPVEVFTNVQTGEIVGDATDANKPSFFSSATKLMPIYITLKAMRDGTIKKDDPIKIKRWRYTSVFGSTNGADEMPGNITAATPDVLLQYIAKRSSNDAPNTLAVHFSDTRDTFYNLENKTAREIGMDPALNHFASATGYNEEGVVGKHKMTPLGMAQLMAKAYSEFPSEFKKLGSEKTTVYALDKKGRETEFKIQSKIPAVQNDTIKELKFMKTGYTCTGGAAGVGIVHIEGIDFAFAYTGYADYKARDAHINKTIVQIREDIESGKIQKLEEPSVIEKVVEKILPADDNKAEPTTFEKPEDSSNSSPWSMAFGCLAGVALAGFGTRAAFNKAKGMLPKSKRPSAKNSFTQANAVSFYSSSNTSPLLSGGTMSFRAANPY